MPDNAILLVTPDPELAERFRSALRPMGRQVHWMESPSDGLKHLRRVAVAVVVADTDLPDEDGITFLNKMRKAAPFAVRMLLMDPASGGETAIEALNRGGVARFLRKPLHDQAEVSRIIEEGIAGYALEKQEREAVENLQYIVQGKAGISNPRALRIERLCTMGEMAGSLIHKFNNTLTIMMGHLDLLLDEIRGTEMEKRLELISKAASDGVQLARTLQEFIRTEPAQRQPVSVNGMITETLRMTEPIWKSNERQRRYPIQMVSELGPAPTIMGNLPDLREVVTNIILNAVDAMPQGGRLTIATTAVPGAVQIRISDTGIGISEEVQRHIFDPFFTTKGKKGNGLGLSIVRRIVEEHGGRIEVESTVGRGTAFSILIPESGRQLSQVDINADFRDAPSLS